METNPIYLTDPYKTDVEAQILKVIPQPDNVYGVILDQTVFYPMGGGQATDQGRLTFQDGSVGAVYQVLLKEGEIVHYMRMNRPPVEGERVKGVIDWERRKQNMRLHTGGHVIDFALYLLGYSPGVLRPMKADHGKKPYIVYEGRLDKDILAELQAKADELIKNNLRFSWSFKPLDELTTRAIYLQPGLPKKKPLRALELEGVGVVADGGTIFATTGEVGALEVISIKEEAGNTIINYKIK